MWATKVEKIKLDVCVFPCSSRPKLLVHALRVACRLHLTSGDAIYAQARRVEISCARPIPVELDGDAGGCVPGRFQIVPQALRILVPPERVAR